MRPAPHSRHVLPGGAPGMSLAGGVVSFPRQVDPFSSRPPLCCLPAPLGGTWDGGARLQGVHEGEVRGDEEGVPRPAGASVLLPHQAEGGQVQGAGQAICRHQLTLPAQLSDQAHGVPRDQR